MRTQEFQVKLSQLRNINSILQRVFVYFHNGLKSKQLVQPSGRRKGFGDEVTFELSLQ